MMAGKLKIEHKFFSLLRTRTVQKRTIIFGLKSDNHCRQILLRLLTVVVKPGDNVLAVHVQEQDDTFDLNTFHIHEDLCKSKQVDFLVKVCIGDSYISELSNEVRINYATILALGCSISGPKDSVVNGCLKALPPTCTLLVMDNVGRILVQRQGTSQQGSKNIVLQSSLSSSSSKYPSFEQPATTRSQQRSKNIVLQSSLSSSSSKYPSFEQPATTRQLHKSLTVPSPTTLSATGQESDEGVYSVRKTVQIPESLKQKFFEKLAILEAEGTTRHFTSQELSHITNNFSPEMLIGLGGNSTVYRANLDDGQVAAVKVLKSTDWSQEEVLREVELLSSMKHGNIVQIIGYCHCKEISAIVYYLFKGSLKQYLKQLKWNERIVIAIGVARALEYLHHFCDPPIIHRDVKSSNILLSENFRPQLSDFGAAIVHHQSHQVSTNIKPVVVGIFGYLAPEYMMYGKVDEKIDVYSYGVVLLELITGKEAIQTNQANHKSLVLWARSLLSCGLCERLIDPHLKEDYNKGEMEIMMCAARLCLLHSSSRRPTMKMILRLFEEPDYWLKMKREKDELLNGINSKGEIDLWRHYDESDCGESSTIYDM